MSPMLFRHMVVAIYEGRKVGGHGSERFDGALKVAAASLVRNGHVELAGEDYEGMTLTATGRALEESHRTDPQAQRKSATYDRYYALWEQDYRPKVST